LIEIELLIEINIEEINIEEIINDTEIEKE